MSQNLKTYTLDEKLKTLMEMESKGLTKREMAKLTGIPVGTIGNWMNNRDEIKIQAKVDIAEQQLPATLDSPTKAKTKREELENQLDYIDKVFALIINPQLSRLARQLNRENNPIALPPPTEPVSTDKSMEKALTDYFSSSDAERLGNLMDRLQKSKIEIMESLEVIYAAEDSHKLKVVDSAEALNRRRDMQRFFEGILIEREQKRLKAIEDVKLAEANADIPAEVVANIENLTKEVKSDEVNG